MGTALEHPRRRRRCVSGFLGAGRCREATLEPVPSSVAGMSHTGQLSTGPVHTEVC